MTRSHVFHFTAGEKVLGTEPQSGVEREMHYYVNDDAVSKVLGSSLDALSADLVDVASAIHIAHRLAVREKASAFPNGSEPKSREPCTRCSHISLGTGGTCGSARAQIARVSPSDKGHCSRSTRASRFASICLAVGLILSP